MKNWEKQSKDLIKTITCLKNESQARDFLRDLLTEKEIIELAARWKAATMLSKQVSYVKISQETGLSSRTVARVSKWLNSGTGGYKQMIRSKV